MTKVSIALALAVVLSGCGGGYSQSNGYYGNPSPVGQRVSTSGSASAAADNGGSTSSSMEEQRVKRYGYAP